VGDKGGFERTKVKINNQVKTMEKDKCLICHSNTVEKKDAKRYRRICRGCRKNSYARHKKDTCERCGFEAIWLGQLDVDHIDGNHFNNDPANLQTLCANCHRLKTYLKGDAQTIGYRPKNERQLTLII